MNNRTTTTQRGLAAAALLGLLAAASACGTDTAVAKDPVGQPGTGQHPQGRAQQLEGQSDRALQADAARAAQGQLPSTPSPAPAGKRVPDLMP